ncbi:MAG: ribosomal RNA small subunit methyltransferase A [Candidatus Omnitrophica bacterium]|nr:ribosomal RNA small subunit methyltransferase A [Candidatus Omnitrophota bacterium]
MRPKKHLAQHYLTDKNIARKIVEESGIGISDFAVEIGPGRGILTEELVKVAKEVTGVEIDAGNAGYLKERFSGIEKLKIVCQDFLKFDLKAEYLKNEQKLKIIGNLPYNITTPILFYLFERRVFIKGATIMVQKEVANRIVAKPGTKAYGILSIAVQFYAAPSVILQVKHDAFYPKPKVDSAVLKLDFLEEPPVKISDADLFFRIVKASFNQRRKIILNALASAGILDLDKDAWNLIIKKAGFDSRIRGEALSMEDFARVCRIVEGSRDFNGEK